MAVQKNLNITTLVIEVGDKTDDSGNTKYSNKNFNNINTSATPENIHAVAEAISAILDYPVGYYYVKETSQIVNAE